MARTKISGFMIGPSDGWYPIGDSWTYASATTINVPSGAASIYQVGDKIKINNPTTKYFYIVTVADTLLTVTGGSDYTVANSAITSPYFSKIENPQGFPNYFDYTPTWTGFSVNPSDIQFKISGKTCTVWGPCFGTSNSATFNFTLPVNCADVPATIAIPVHIYDNGNWSNTIGTIGIGAHGGGLNLAKVGANSATIAANAYGSFTASSGKGFSGSFSYPI